MSNLTSLLGRFAKRREGSVATMLGLTFTMVTGATFAAIEIEEMQRTRAEMQQRLDATLLYLGGTDDKINPQAAGEAFLRNSVETAGMNVENLVSTFTFDGATGNVTGTATFNTDSLISGKLLPEIELAVEAVATPKVVGRVEISMVLDTSGSMEWAFGSDTVATSPNRRIDGLHEAAEDMFDVIYQNPLAEPAVSVVPYSTSVDITDVFAAADLSTKNAGYKRFGSSYGSLSGLGILSDLVGGLLGLDSHDDITDLTTANVTLRNHEGGQGIWAAERYVGQNYDGTYNVSLDAPGGSRKIPVITQTDVDRSCHWSYTSNYGSYCIDISKYNGLSGWYAHDSLRPTNGVLPMTLVGQDVRNYVASLEPSGGTAGHIGAAWGAYMLTPGWHSTFDHPAGAPANFDETTEKYLVFMTDGVFNSQKDPYMSDNEMYKYFQSVCKKLRDNGVRVFTVGLIISDENDDDTSTAQKQRTNDELSACAGQTGHYYSAENRAQLVDAFRSVGRATGELRISH